MGAGASGWGAAHITAMTYQHIITMPEAAMFVHVALAAGDEPHAIRMLTEAIARLLGSGGRNLPAGTLDEPGPTGDPHFDAVLAAAVLYAAGLCGFVPPAWAVEAAGLPDERVYGGDGFESTGFKDFIRASTPAVFLERNILCRPRDWETARNGFGRA